MEKIASIVKHVRRELGDARMSALLWEHAQMIDDVSQIKVLLDMRK